MMNVQDLYKSKFISVEESLEYVKDGDEVVFGMCVQEPSAIMSKFHTIYDRINDVTVWLTLIMGKYPFFSTEYMDKIHMNSWFLTPPLRSIAKERKLTFQPSDLHNGMTRRIEVRPPDVFIGTVTPMDKHGFVRAPLSLVYEKEFIEAADIVIMEVNPNLPRVHGDTQIHISEIDAFVECNRPIPILPRVPLTEVDLAIGEYVASLVEDGSTIQLGIGRIPDASAQALMTKKDLGVHTEMITSGIADLAKAGVITGKKKTLHKGKIVGAFALGDQALYDFLDDNPSILMLRGPYVNNPFVIAQNEKMVSINTAIQLDFTGQISSESVGTEMISGTGGQTDTAYGAIHSKGGKSIIALHSTALDGKVSAIVPTLLPGAGVTMSRNVIDYVITEYGIAPMKSRTYKERARNLIGIAHPSFRDELTQKAKELGYL